MTTLPVFFANAGKSIFAESPYPSAAAENQRLPVKCLYPYTYVCERPEAECFFHCYCIFLLALDRDALYEKAVAGVLEVSIYIGNANLKLNEEQSP